MSAVVGRQKEIARIKACLQAGRNLILEGPVGVGKTHLAMQILQDLKRGSHRIDGDGRYSEQKLTGWFDPPAVISKGYGRDTFIPGPLTEAMQSGEVLFINELNRMPEGVQNVLLPAIDEKWLTIPRLGEVQAQAGFQVIATQNPKEFVATSHLSEAILDRFELIRLDYQSEDEEIEIVRTALQTKKVEAQKIQNIPSLSVRLVRKTRNHPQVRRGASVRAAIAVAELTLEMMTSLPLAEAFLEAAIMALPTRIELDTDRDNSSEESFAEEFLQELAESTLKDSSSTEKKN